MKTYVQVSVIFFRETQGYLSWLETAASVKRVRLLFINLHVYEERDPHILKKYEGAIRSGVIEKMEARKINTFE